MRTTIDRVYPITEVGRIITYVKSRDIPAILRDEEMLRIKTMLEYSNNISVSNNFQRGDKAEILNGPLNGLQGTIVKKNSKTRLIVFLKELKQYISVTIDPDNLKIRKIR